MQCSLRLQEIFLPVFLCRLLTSVAPCLFHEHIYFAAAIIRAVGSCDGRFKVTERHHELYTEAYDSKDDYYKTCHMLLQLIGRE